MIKKTIIYDLDGTIINSSRDIIRSFNTAFKINNIKKIDYEFFINNASRGSLNLIKQNLKKNQFFKLKKINKDFHKIYSSNCVKYTNCKIARHQSPAEPPGPFDPTGSIPKSSRSWLK